MSAKSIFILTLVMSLFCSTQVYPVTTPDEVSKGACAKRECTMGCCARTACCGAMEQHRERKPMQESSRVDFQLATIELRGFTLLCFPRPTFASRAVRDETNAGHTPPPLAVTCIRLI